MFGLNPAGYEIAAEKEKKNRTYLYSLSDKNINSSYVYNNYYRPIYTLMNDIFNNEVKWHWCNKSWDILSKEIEHSIEHSENKDFLDEIHEEYLNIRKSVSQSMLGICSTTMKQIQENYRLKVSMIINPIVVIC